MVELIHVRIQEAPAVLILAVVVAVVQVTLVSMEAKAAQVL
jgi:hypothetical protein